VAFCRRQFANLLARMSRHDDARGRIERATAEFEALTSENPNSTDLRLQLAWCRLEAGDLLMTARRPREALDRFAAARPDLDRLAADQPEAQPILYALGASMEKAGDALRALGRPDEALASVREALAVHQRMSDRNPTNREVRSWTTLDHVVLAATLFEARRPDDAIREYRLAAARYESEPALRPGDWYNLGCVHARLATLIGAGGPGADPDSARHTDLAVAALRRAVALGYRDAAVIRSDPDLEPLRGRPEYRLLLLDAAFPADPFAR
jgi:tetratricopeptide (TPR) repeat protein